MITTTFTDADVRDGLDLLLLVECPVGTLAIFECLAEIPSDLATAVWEAVPQEKYSELEGWAVDLLLDSSIVDGQPFDNGLTSIQRVLRAFRVLPPEFKKAIWGQIPQARQQELRTVPA